MDEARHRRERGTGRAADTDRQRQRFSPHPCLRLLCITRSFNGIPWVSRQERDRERQRALRGPPRKPGQDGRNPDFRSGIPSELLARRHTHTHTRYHATVRQSNRQTILTLVAPSKVSYNPSILLVVSFGVDAIPRAANSARGCASESTRPAARKHESGPEAASTVETACSGTSPLTPFGLPPFSLESWKGSCAVFDRKPLTKPGFLFFAPGLLSFVMPLNLSDCLDCLDQMLAFRL